jgi:sugar phosphate isomerase/epimerase
LAIDLLGPYLAHVHVKDVAFAPGPGWNGQTARFAPLGDGAIHWPLCLATLRRAGYAGWLAIENFTGIERGPARILQDAHWLRAAIAASAHEEPHA